MTRKDYVLLAAALKDAMPLTPTKRIGWTCAVAAIARALARDNPRFDNTRFLIAAGIVL